MIFIIDHNAGNLRSVVNALAKLNYLSMVTIGPSNVLDTAHSFYLTQCAE